MVLEPNLIFILIGALLLALGLYRLLFGIISKGWPVVEARVSERNHVVNGGPNDALNRLNVKYSYFVKGKKYIGSRLCFGSIGFGNMRELMGSFNELQQGGAIEIRYWPLFPSFSVYLPGFVDLKKNIAFVFFGIVLIGLF